MEQEEVGILEQTLQLDDLTLDDGLAGETNLKNEGILACFLEAYCTLMMSWRNKRRLV